MKNYSLKKSFIVTGATLVVLSIWGCGQSGFRSNLASESSNAIDGQFGVYFWGGVPDVSPASNAFQTGISAITSQGFRTARIAVSSDALNTYGFTAPTCGSTTYLKCALEQTPIEATLKASSLSTILITAYDGTSYAGNNFLNNTYMSNTVNQAAITAEYKDLAYALMQDFNGSGRTFILASWEGDNQIYCGQSATYATVAESKSSCDTYLSTNGFVNIDNVISAYTQWHAARKAGIAQAIAEAQAAGLSGVTVLSGIEGNSLNLLHDNGFKSVFRDVVPVVQPDVVLYSSYETLGIGLTNRDITAQVNTDLTALKALIGSSKLYLGEYGFSTTSFGLATAQASTVELLTAVRALKKAGTVDGAILWEFYENPTSPDPGYGLFDIYGAARPIFEVLEAAFLGQTVSAAPDVAVTGLGDLGNGNTLTAAAVLYGSFPFTDITGFTSDCGLTPTLTSQNGEQVTITFGATATNLNCRFRSVRAGGQVSDWSPSFPIDGSPVLNIVNVASLVPADTNTYLSLFGYFLTVNTIAVTSSCADINPTVTYRSSGLINFQFPNVAASESCTFTVTADGRTNTSAPYSVVP